MRKINWEPIKNFAEGVGTILGVGFVTCASIWCAGKSEEFNKVTCVAGYSDAVDVIMKSDMHSYYKQEAVKVLKRDGDEEYYKAIANIAKAEDMHSYYKAVLIEELSAK